MEPTSLLRDWVRKGCHRAWTTHVEPGSRTSCAVTEHGDQEGLQAVEQLLALGSRAQLHTEQAYQGSGQGLFLALPCRDALQSAPAQGSTPSQCHPRAPDPTFLKALFQGIGQCKVAFQQEVRE